MPSFAHHLTHLLEANTYPVLLALVMLESLGIPLPGEIALVTAAAYASHGHVSIYIVIALAAIGAIVGGVLGYWIGIRGGLPLIAHYGGYVGVRRSHIAKAHEFFENNGGKTILIGRFIAFLRTFAPLIAGAACMSFTKFVIYNALSSVIWAIVFGWLGYYFGHDLPLLESYISRASLFLLIALAVGIPVFVVWKRRRRPIASATVPAAESPLDK